jgi:hypothetical protein
MATIVVLRQLEKHPGSVKAEFAFCKIGKKLSSKKLKILYYLQCKFSYYDTLNGLHYCYIFISNKKILGSLS